MLEIKGARDLLCVDGPIPVLEIGGLGPQYDDVLLTLTFRFWLFLELAGLPPEAAAKPEIKAQFDKLAADIHPSGTQWGTAIAHASWLRKHGYEAWLREGKMRGVEIYMWSPHLDFPEGSGKIPELLSELLSHENAEQGE